MVLLYTSIPDPGGYWWPPTYSNRLLLTVLVQHVLLYFFVIVVSTLPGLYESMHIFHMDIGGHPPNPTDLFWKFSCKYIFLYFQGHFGALNNVFLAFHSQTIDKVKV
jgi:hypothetical protein